MSSRYVRAATLWPAATFVLAACIAVALATTVVACSAGATPTATPSPTLAASPTVQPLLGSAHEAGTYRTRQFNPQVLLTLQQGWSVYFDELNGTYMTLGKSDLLVGKSGDVVDPATHQRAPNPDDVMAWLVAHPELNATDPTPIQISGYDASWVEVDPTHSVDVFYDPLGNFHVGPGRARFYVIPWDGPDMFIAVLKPEVGTFEEALTVGVPVAESVQILK